MRKPVVIGVVVAVLVIIAAGYSYYYWQYKKSQVSKTPEEKAVESATKGVLPEINPLSNPLEKQPELNPVEKVNPFKYQNPLR